MDTRNHEHYKDKTAHDAIKAADKPPDSVTRTINAMKAVAAIDEFEVFGRIKLRDKKTGKNFSSSCFKGGRQTGYNRIIRRWLS